MTTLRQFNAFLETVDLQRYRAKYSPIKLVERDLPRTIQAIAPLYREYWDTHQSELPSFEEFYDRYATTLTVELEAFRKKAMFSKETFYRGLPARTYRTWVSLLTQIQGGYAAAELYGMKNISMSSELDYAGIDLRITGADGEICNIQIKKETMSREVRAPWHMVKKNQKIIKLIYAVPGCEPLTKTGKESVPYLRWEKEWEGKLNRLPNGFIVFMPAMFAKENLAP